MVRIKTTTKEGVEFLSPFVFTGEQARRKVDSIMRWHTWRDYPKLEVVPVVKYNPLTIWKEDHPIFDEFVADHIGMLKQLETTWL